MIAGERSNSINTKLPLVDAAGAVDVLDPFPVVEDVLKWQKSITVFNPENS